MQRRQHVQFTFGAINGIYSLLHAADAVYIFLLLLSVASASLSPTSPSSQYATVNP